MYKVVISYRVYLVRVYYVVYCMIENYVRSFVVFEY